MNLEKVEQMYRRFHDDYRAALTLTHIAHLKEQSGEMAEARSDLQNSLSVLVANPEDPNTILVWSSLGLLYDLEADYKTATYYHETARTYSELQPETELWFSVLNNQVNHYYLDGDIDSAQELVSSTILANARNKQNVWIEVRALSILATIYMKNGQYQMAANFYDLGRKALEKKPNPNLSHILTLNQAYCRSFLNEADLALRDLETVLLPEVQTKKLTSLEADTLLLIGRLSLQQKKHDKAATFLEQAFQIYQKRNDPGGMAEARLLESKRLAATGQLEKAETLSKESVELINRSTLTANLTERIQFFATTQAHYDNLIDILMQRHAVAPTAGFDRQAFLVNEKRLSRGILEALAAKQNRTDSPGHNSAELAELNKIEAKIQELAEKRSQLATRFAEKATERNTIERELANALRERERLRARHRQDDFATVSYPDFAEIRKNALDPETALVAFSLGTSTSYAWVVTESGLTSFALPDRSEIVKAVSSLKAPLPKFASATPAQAEEIDTSAKSFQVAARRLSALLLEKIQLPVGVKRLALIRPDELSLVPFAALPLPRKNTPTPLITQYEVVNIPSASALCRLRQRAETLKGFEPNQVAVVADPIYSYQDERLGKLAEPRKGEGTQLALAQSMLRGAELVRLPATGSEATMIDRLTQGKAVKIVGFDASRNALLGDRLKRVRVLHVAAHGLNIPKYPQLSSLVLSLIDRQGHPQDGFLTQADVAELDMAADLVVLSVCRGGAGKVLRGQGSLSLSRAFLLAGSNRVLASVWDVEDTAG
ncbi:MAG: CHAT domain-containing protein [Blastocatellia bacterium]|nr:CHAT domain-containing protein [Blastocatellia bacterium]